MRCFSYCMKDNAKKWLMALPAGTLTTWAEVEQKFFSKFFPSWKTKEIKWRIAKFQEEEGEAFHESWERFKLLLSQCPHHDFTLQSQVQSFYDGLTGLTQAIVDNACGGAMRECTADFVFNKYEMLGQNSQQRSTKGSRTSSAHLAMQMETLSNNVKAMMVSQQGQQNQPGQVCQQVKVCQACGMNGHGADTCTAQREVYSEAEAQAMYQWNQGRQRNNNNAYQQPRNDQNQSWGGNTRNQYQGQQGTGNSNQWNSHNPPPTYQQEMENRMISIEASLKKLSIQLGQVIEANGQQDRGKAPMHEQTHAITSSRSGYTTKEQDPGSFELSITVGDSSAEKAILDL